MVVMAAGLGLGAWPGVVLADGGIVRFAERRGDRLITVLTTPTPLRAGIVDVSVLVQEARSGQPLRDVPIVVHAQPIQGEPRRISARATTAAATNKLLHAAQLDLGESGRWHVDVIVQDTDPASPIGFDVDVNEPLPPWLDMTFWIGWPVAAIGLFAIHQWLGHRRERIRS